MALLSSQTIVRTFSILHLTIAYYLLTAPYKIADQNLVFILGEAMGLPHAHAFTTPAPPTALLAALLFLLALADLTATSLPPEAAAQHWGAQAPVRLLFFFALLGYTYLFKAGGVLGPAVGKGDGDGGVDGRGVGVGGELKNRVVFTWAFLEMLGWFWVYVTLRDERREVAARVVERRKVEEDML